MTREQEVRMDELISILTEASNRYYNGEEMMSNKEYDALFDELATLEKETGIIRPTSPTQHVGAVVDNLNKVVHEYPALSLDKTKNIDEMQLAFIKGFKALKEDGYDPCPEDVILMWKLDGGTVVATYEDGKLVTLATRGNGKVGSDITHNAPFIEGLPMKIDHKGKLIIRGEAMMSYEEFERINSSLSEDEKYKNPRNLANATIQMLDSNELKNRKIHFMAHAMVFAERREFEWGKPAFLVDQFENLRSLGIDVVPYESINVLTIADAVKRWTENVPNFEYPVDGLVLAMDNDLYASCLPGTAHNPNIMSGYALKWEDETVETTLRDIEWSASRTGLLNPVAIFDPVELEGTTITRASLHNVSYIKDLNLLPGDKITVYKANKIIPQLDKNLSENHHGPIDISILGKWCPCCKNKTELVKSNISDTIVRKCVNPKCPAKMVGKFVHFCERDCMNIEGLSEATITTFLEKGFIKSFTDLFHLERYKAEIEALEGFGSKSYENIIKAVNEARSADFVSFINALGIPNVGKGQAKLLKPVSLNACKTSIESGAMKDSSEYVRNSVEGLMEIAKEYDFSLIDGIGPVIAKSITEYFTNEDNVSEIRFLLKEIHIKDVISTNNGKFEGKVFVITGSLNSYPNRDALIAEIESLGGKVSGSVSKNTDYLINNDVASTSGKNKKAMELGVKIISELEYLNMK